MSTRGRTKHKNRLSLEAAALKDIFIGKGHQQNNKASMEANTNRHSMHLVPVGALSHTGEYRTQVPLASLQQLNLSHAYADPYHMVVPPPPAAAPPKHFDGYIHVGQEFFEDKKKAKRKESVRGRPLFARSKSKASKADFFAAVPPLSCSTPPPAPPPPLPALVVSGQHAPYYVGDTMRAPAHQIHHHVGQCHANYGRTTVANSLGEESSSNELSYSSSSESNSRAGENKRRNDNGPGLVQIPIVSHIGQGGIPLREYAVVLESRNASNEDYHYYANNNNHVHKRHGGHSHESGGQHPCCHCECHGQHQRRHRRRRSASPGGHGRRSLSSSAALETTTSASSSSEENIEEIDQVQEQVAVLYNENKEASSYVTAERRSASANSPHSCAKKPSSSSQREHSKHREVEKRGDEGGAHREILGQHTDAAREILGQQHHHENQLYERRCSGETSLSCEEDAKQLGVSGSNQGQRVKCKNEQQHILEKNQDHGELVGKHEVVLRRRKTTKVGRSPTQKLLNRSAAAAMVNDTSNVPWGGVSGVPGLGVSIPQRPRSACEFDFASEDAWSRMAGASAPSKFELIGVAKKLAGKVAKKKTSSNASSDTASVASLASVSNKLSHEESVGSSNSSWSPHSIQSLSHLKLDLPRVRSSDPAVGRGASPSHRSSGRSSSNGSSVAAFNPPQPSKVELHPPSASRLQHKKASFRASSANPFSHSVLPRVSKRSLSAQHSHSPSPLSLQNSSSNSLVSHHPLAHSKSVAQPPSAKYMNVSQVHWSDDVYQDQDRHHHPLRRSSNQRKTFHHGSDDKPAFIREMMDKSAHRPLSQSILDKKLSFNPHNLPPHLSNILKSMGNNPELNNSGPLSLPPRFVEGREIPRAPIPVPPPHHRQQASEEEDEESEGHYEKLKKGGKVAKSSMLAEQLKKKKPLLNPARRSSAPATNTNTSFGSSSFDSVEIPFPPQLPRKQQQQQQQKSSSSHQCQQHYKVLNDRDGDYSYAYDCSLSPAFLIRYNEEQDRREHEMRAGNYVSRRNSDGENIYEEILEVKKLIRRRSQSSEGENPYEVAEGVRSKSEDKFNQSSSSGSSSSYNTKSSSIRTDSGVHMTSRKFSSDTLDFGPKSGASRAGNRKISRFSNDSSDSFGISESSDDNSHEKSSSNQKKNGPLNDSIRQHHRRVLEQLQVDDGSSQEIFTYHGGRVQHASPSPSGGADRDSGIQGDAMSGDSERATKSAHKSVSRIKGLKFGFSQRRSKTVDANMNLAKPTVEAVKEQENNVAATEQKSFFKRCLSKLPSMNPSASSSNSNSKEITAGKSLSSLTSASLSSSTSMDNISFSDEEPGKTSRFLRSRITSKWENVHHDDEEEEEEC